MKTPLIIVASFLIVGSSFAGLPTSVKGRRITEVNLIPQRVLKKSISEKFYKSLMVSPIDGWVVASGKLSGTDVFGERIVRSDLDGRFNNAALQVLRDIKMMGDYKLDSQIKTSTVLLHMLVYEIADGTMVLYFATLGDAGSDQDDYFGAAKLAVLKKDGTWTEIKTADSGKGLYVRGAGLRSNGQAALKLETFNPLRP
ncbi:MAG TPA: hypothetical protein VK993_06800 [Chthoniobacterales bacterium]|nr:hypothetical protein [Chthoniobacterales bacterium]